MADRIQFRRGTASAWTSINPILAQGEPGFETDTGYLKVGDGLSPWAALPYVSSSPGGGGGTLGDATTTAKGAVKLAGALSGTADSPTVPDLANRAVSLGGTVRIWAASTTFPSSGMVEGDLFPYVGV